MKVSTSLLSSLRHQYISSKIINHSYFTCRSVEQVGRAISFIGSVLALGLMTVISVLIGYGFKSVPDALKSSVPIGRYLSVACMLYFGLRTLQVRVCHQRVLLDVLHSLLLYDYELAALNLCVQECAYGVLQEAWQTSSEPDEEGGELVSAQLSLDEAEKKGSLETQTAWQALLQVLLHARLSYLPSDPTFALITDDMKWLTRQCGAGWLDNISGRMG